MADLISFVEEPNGNGFFRIGRQYLFVNGVEFTLTGVKLGHYERNGSPLRSETLQTPTLSILLVTSIDGETIPATRFLRGKRVVYNSRGEAEVVYAAEFHEMLLKHLESKFGRLETDQTCLNATAEEVGKEILEYFKGKTILCVDRTGFAKDKDGKLVPGAPFTVFTIKQ